MTRFAGVRGGGRKKVGSREGFTEVGSRNAKSGRKTIDGGMEGLRKDSIGMIQVVGSTVHGLDSCC